MPTPSDLSTVTHLGKYLDEIISFLPSSPPFFVCLCSPASMYRRNSASEIRPCGGCDIFVPLPCDAAKYIRTPGLDSGAHVKRVLEFSVRVVHDIDIHTAVTMLARRICISVYAEWCINKYINMYLEREK